MSEVVREGLRLFMDRAGVFNELKAELRAKAR